VLLSDFGKKHQTKAFVALACGGILACALSVLFDRSPIRFYDPSDYDYWHTSPNFFLMRCGILLVILFLAYAWCRWGFAQRGFSPVVQLGQTSLLVYWVHMEFVYGRLSILPKGRCSIAAATAGLIIIFFAMLALSIGKTNWKKRAVRASQARPSVVATAEPV
jgi:fucose 4-O-acetylase-like acetyltransferase